MFESTFLAQIIGIVASASGIALLLNADFFQKMFQEIVKNPALFVLSGFGSFLIGIIILVGYFSKGGLGILITVCAAIAMAKGAAILFFPKEMQNFSQKILEKKSSLFLGGAANTLLGIFFLYFGFCA